MADKKIYIRDKRSPTPSSENVSKLMSSNKGKDTKPELLLRKLLWKNGLKGYRIHPKKIPGKPDVCFTSNKIVIFETRLKDCLGVPLSGRAFRYNLLFVPHKRISASIPNANTVHNENSTTL